MRTPRPCGTRPEPRLRAGRAVAAGGLPHCRSRRCSDAPDDRDLDVHRSDAGRPATVFARRIRRHGRLYLQYWLYYPDSNSVLGPSDTIWNNSPLRLFGGYPGYHADDWEGYAVRVDPDGSVWVRATLAWPLAGVQARPLSQRMDAPQRVDPGLAGEPRRPHPDRDGSVERRRRPARLGAPPAAARRAGASAGPAALRAPVPGVDFRERTTRPPEGLRLIPLETLRRDARRRYRPRDPGVSPPWRKPAWRDPEDERSEPPELEDRLELGPGRPWRASPAGRTSRSTSPGDDSGTFTVVGRPFDGRDRSACG